ncbi:MAG TPA: hypothetical protein VGO52_15395 [Hyphomonadaceae bacterium]|jgi:hypothetical protein|nr:hypothetical protein [Hyphomonadaceae bacterium]
MQFLAKLFPDWPAFVILTTLALPLAMMTWKVFQRMRNGADYLQPSLHFLLGVAAIIAAAANVSTLFSMGIEPPLTHLPLLLAVGYTLWMMPKAARTWWKKPEPERKKKPKLPGISLDNILPGLPTLGLPQGSASGARNTGGDEGPKLQRVRAGRLDFRIFWAILGFVVLTFFLVWWWLAGVFEAEAGFVLIVLSIAAIPLLWRRRYRDTFLVEEADEEKDEQEDGFGLDLSREPGSLPTLPIPARARRPQEPTQGPPKFGKRRA